VTRLVTMWMVLVFVLFEIALVAYGVSAVASAVADASQQTAVPIVSTQANMVTLSAPACANALEDPTDAVCAYYHADVTDAGYVYDRNSHRYIKVIVDDDSVKGAV
jgi:hypothetical protein